MTTTHDDVLVTRAPAAGPVVGRTEDRVTAFRGIPYGEPPVGERRFRPPVPRAPWTEPLPCLEHRPIVPQPWDVLDEKLDVPQLPASEADALQLTVSVPAGTEPGAGLPVMVWIHGGSLTTGSCTWPMYDGTAFARDGVVFVGVNYRLHALGFLDLSEAFGEPDAVNVGLRDVVLALRWVQDNIAAFGGDPSTVTIFGESAGGTLVGALTALPDATRLFRRAILQSGANLQLVEPDEARRLTANFLAAAGVRPGDRAALEALDVDDVVARSQDPRLVEGVPRMFVPWNITRDPALVPRTGLDAAEAGDTAGLDLMLGWTLDESRLEWLGLPPEEGRLPEIDRVDPGVVTALDALYGRDRPELTAAERLMALSSDQYFAVPAVRIAEAQVARGGRAHLYEFRWASPVLDGLLGSCHAMEVPFVFDMWVSPSFTGPERPAELVERMHRAWIAFATTGDPQGEPGEGELRWTVYDEQERRVMVFDTRSGVQRDPRGAVRAAWRAVPTAAIGII